MDITTLKRKGITGSITGWDNISTDIENAATAPMPDKYTIPEMLDMIRDIRVNFDKKNLEKLMLLLEDHIHNTNNPHMTSLESMGTNVIAELYKEWKALNNTGTIEEFIKVLFQFIEIADISTTLQGISTTKLVSVAGVQAVYQDHLVDMNAHEEMFRSIFPGVESDISPVYATHAFIGASTPMIIERESPILYHDEFGYLQEAGPNTLPADYLYRYPLYPIWGPRTNYITQSDTLESGVILGATKLAAVEMNSPKIDSYASLIIENDDNVTDEHGWQSDTLSFVADNVYTISIYAFPLDRQYLSIVLPDGLAGINNHKVLDLIDIDQFFEPHQFDNTINKTECIQLPNGWVKIIHSFKAQTTMTNTIKILFVDILNGDTSYIGTGKTAGALWHPQVELGLGASAPIITQEFPVTRPGTKVRVPFTELFNNTTGSLVVETKKPLNLQQNITHTLYEVGSDTGTTLKGSFPISHKGRLFMESVNLFNQPFNYTWTSSEKDDDIDTYVHSYSPREYVYADMHTKPIYIPTDDESITYAQAADYIISELWSTLNIGTSLIEFNNNLSGTEYTYNNVTSVEALTYMLTGLYEKVKGEKFNNKLALIDFLSDSELSKFYTLNNQYEYLYIGCNNDGTEFYNGYIKSISYYTKYSDEIGTEFLVGEYVYE